MTLPPVQPTNGSVGGAISPAAREHVIARLTERYTQDHLSLEEFERRAEAAYAVTTPAALAELTADLGADADGLSPVRASIPSMQVRVMLGSVSREMVEVPRRLDVRSLLGNVELDLTRARFAPGVTEIALHAVMGNIEIQLPANVGVEDHVSAMLGSFEYRSQPRASSWTESSRVDSVVRFTGQVTLSSAEVVIRRDSGGFARVAE
ncbi:MAG TPA: LiaF domain-containing protein [Gemmatimonadaceae bacterium]|nr:LiaF domain-containing protein [Gemmatimonadaceae bacterium]